MLSLKRMKDCNIPRTIRFPEQLFEDLKDVAFKNDISFNALIIRFCEYGLENLEEDEKVKKNK